MALPPDIQILLNNDEDMTKPPLKDGKATTHKANRQAVSMAAGHVRVDGRLDRSCPEADDRPMAKFALMPRLME